MSKSTWSSKVHEVRFAGLVCKAVDTPWGVVVKLPGRPLYRVEMNVNTEIQTEIQPLGILTCHRHLHRVSFPNDGRVILFPNTPSQGWFLYDAKLVERPEIARANLSATVPEWELLVTVECPRCREERERVMSDAFRQYELAEGLR